jgi:hypothetical protein
MAVELTVSLEVAITLTEELWLPPSTNRVLPSGETARLRAAPVAIGDPTSASVLVSTSTTWLSAVSAT